MKNHVRNKIIVLQNLVNRLLGKKILYQKILGLKFFFYKITSGQRNLELKLVLGQKFFQYKILGKKNFDQENVGSGKFWSIKNSVKKIQVRRIL